MKTLKFLLFVLFIIPSISYATFTVPWVATSTTQGWISPSVVNGNLQTIVGKNYIATSTTATSTFSGKVSIGTATTYENNSLTVLGTSLFGYSYAVPNIVTFTSSQIDDANSEWFPPQEVLYRAYAYKLDGTVKVFSSNYIEETENVVDFEKSVQLAITIPAGANGVRVLTWFVSEPIIFIGGYDFSANGNYIDDQTVGGFGNFIWDLSLNSASPVNQNGIIIDDGNLKVSAKISIGGSLGTQTYPIGLLEGNFNSVSDSYGLLMNQQARNGKMNNCISNSGFNGEWSQNYFCLIINGGTYAGSDFLSQPNAGLGLITAAGNDFTKLSIGTTNGKPVSFFTNNIERLYIDSAGKVGIGTTSPTNQLGVDGSVLSSEIDTYDSTATSTFKGSFSAKDSFYVLQNGFVSIGTTTPASALSVYGFINTDAASGYKQNNQTVFVSTTTANDLAIGVNALVNNLGLYSTSTNVTSGQQNVAIGEDAMRYSTSSSYNTAVGYQALKGLAGSRPVSTGGNVAFGTQALRVNTSGSNNDAFGYAALYNNTTGYQNLAIGSFNLYNNTTGNSNTSIGYDNLFIANPATQNIAVGSLALYYNNNASYNVAIGYKAGYGINGAGSQNNTFVGHQSGWGNGNNGNNNTCIGYQSCYDLSTGQANIGIGYNVGISSSTTNGQMNIGGILFGTGLYNGATVNSAEVSTGKVGVATTSPWARLSVAGAPAQTNPLFIISSSTTSYVSTSTVFIIDSNGKIGINTESPTTMLDINGWRMRLRQPHTPATSGEACDIGTISWDTSYFYLCVATNTWKRFELQAF